MLAETITIWTIVALGAIILFLVIVNILLNRINERLMNEQNEIVLKAIEKETNLSGKLMHERTLRKQAEEALIQAQEEKSQLLAETPNTSTVYPMLKQRVASVEALEMVDGQGSTAKPRKSERLESKKK